MWSKGRFNNYCIFKVAMSTNNILRYCNPYINLTVTFVKDIVNVNVICIFRIKENAKFRFEVNEN